MVQMVERIAHREGLGNLLAEGSRRAAQVIGGEAPFFTIEVKGQELAMHDPRGKLGSGSGLQSQRTALITRCRITTPCFKTRNQCPLKRLKLWALPKPFPPGHYPAKKAKNYLIGENWSSFEKTVGLCYFGPAPRSFIQVDEEIKAVHFATGWDVTLEELLKVGERATNLARVFNVREGFSAGDDRLPERLFSPLEGGALTGVAISREDFKQALQELYELKGRHAEITAPTRERLKNLQIEWAADLIDGA